jgi:gluconolactonase
MVRFAPFVITITSACDETSPAPGDAAISDTSLIDPLMGVGAVELVASGFQFTEGPQWRVAAQDLVFTDIPANTIFRYTPGGPPPTALRMPSNNANGLATDANGALLAAEHGSRAVTRDATVVVDRFEGLRLNSPNDLIATPDGSIYFTDPPFGIQPNQRELDFIGVFRISPAGTLTAEHRGALSERPNGIGRSPAAEAIYVADSADGVLYRFRVEAGALSARAELARTAGAADGLAVDAAGNIFVTSRAGIEVFSPGGIKWGTIAVPEQPANCAFGDADLRTLYVTARTSLYRVRLANVGTADH